LNSSSNCIATAPNYAIVATLPPVALQPRHCVCCSTLPPVVSHHIGYHWHATAVLVLCVILWRAAAQGVVITMLPCIMVHVSPPLMGESEIRVKAPPCKQMMTEGEHKVDLAKYEVQPHGVEEHN